MSGTTVSTALITAAKKVSIYSAFSPPYELDVEDFLNAPSSGTPDPVVRVLQPAVILSGGLLGTQTIAPNGVPDPDAWKTNLMIVGGIALGLAGLVFAAGANWERKRRGR